MKLKPQHISKLVVSLADFVRMADRKIIANTLSQLKLELDFDSTAISQLQVVLFGFQDAVSITQRKTFTIQPLIHPFTLKSTLSCTDGGGSPSGELSVVRTRQSQQSLPSQQTFVINNFCRSDSPVVANADVPLIHYLL